MILHIPHASANIPDREGFLDEEKVQAEILKLTDWYTDDLFQSEEAIRLIAPFSRVFCDVEMKASLKTVAHKNIKCYF
jgi:N-formylglutamate amidohydrolase